MITIINSNIFCSVEPTLLLVSSGGPSSYSKTLLLTLKIITFLAKLLPTLHEIIPSNVLL